MKTKVVLIYFLVLGLIVFLAAEAKSDKKSLADNKALPKDASIAAIGCYANVPGEGSTYTAIQFQASATEDDTPGGLVSTDNIVGDMHFVPPSSPYAFIQGSLKYEEGRNDDEDQFSHKLTRRLAVMKTEVTWEMWAALKVEQPSLPDNPSGYDDGWGDTNPVHKVTWRECILFANLLSEENGFIRCYYTDSSKTTPISASNYLTITIGSIYCDFSANGYRLPTEGEWEYFCRAGTQTPFHITESNYSKFTKTSCSAYELPNLASVAKYCANSGFITNPVCNTYMPGNNWNLCDTHGNVMEWCWDGYFKYPTGIVTDYAGKNDVPERILRGGYWGSEPMNCRAAWRFKHSSDPTAPRKNEAGFRLVRSLFY
jgi:formylglycine-generating enzyme required for sulfatase activity